jgi:dCTP deaminase
MLNKTNNGALSGFLIKDLIDAGSVIGSEEKNIRLSSLDLSLSDEIYKVQGFFHPYQGETVRDVLSLIEKKRHSLSNPLKKGEMYIARLNESFSLPSSVYGFCNPKSTTGRLDVHVRLIADKVPRFDSVTPKGWKGELWVSIIPKTFSIKLFKKQSLNQIRFFNADTRLSNLELELFTQKTPLLFSSDNKKIPWKNINTLDRDGSLILSLDCSSDVVGYKAKESSEVLDLSRLSFYKKSDFFVPVRKRSKKLYLKKNEFYILSTQEQIRVPPWLACEMVPMDERSGEFRSHYAGFIDPGWGWGKNGKGRGRTLTLEVRPFEDLVVRDNQPIAKISFERVAGRIKEGYDDIDSNYIQQKGARLAKQFQV